MATTDDGQLQKQVPGEPPPITGNDPQPVTQDEQLQTPIPDEPPPQTGNDPQPVTQDEQLQIPIPDEPPLQTGNDPQPVTQEEQLQTPIPDEPPLQPKEGPSDPSRGLCSQIVTIAVVFLFIGGIIVLIVWSVIRPGITVYVESASLTSFNLSSSNILHHSLFVELSMRNPSRSDSARYSRVETSAYYDGNWFQWSPLDDFYLGHKETIKLRAVMVGATPIELGASEVELYSKQRKAGAFDLEVRLKARVWYRIWTSKSTKTQTRTRTYKCFLPGLRLGATGGFLRTKC